MWLANYNFTRRTVHVTLLQLESFGLMRLGFLPLNVIDFKGVQTGPSCGEAQTARDQPP
jgi:hypothetical protein